MKIPSLNLSSEIKNMSASFFDNDDDSDEDSDEEEFDEDEE